MAVSPRAWRAPPWPGVGAGEAEARVAALEERVMAEAEALNEAALAEMEDGAEA